MKRNTIKWRVFKNNLIVIVLLILLVSIIFNIAVRVYIENDVIVQLDKITLSTVNTALKQGPALYNGPKKGPLHTTPQDLNREKDLQYYSMLNRSLKEPLSLLNAEYILLDKNKNMVIPLSENYTSDSIYPASLLNELLSKVKESSENFNSEKHLTMNISGVDYIAVVKPLSEKNDFGLSWIIIFSSLEKVNQLQLSINIILLVILAFSSIITILLSSNLSQKLTKPFYTLNQHIKSIAKRDFGNQITMPVYEELQEVVNSINNMSEKLGSYDKAQKTFLQNVSHEFRTPLMSIQSYAEGIKYQVVEPSAAVDIILDESKRMTRMLEELLYLSRLEAIEESYNYEKLNVNELLDGSIERLNEIATQNCIKLIKYNRAESIKIIADEEKFSRAIANVLSNCIRYAETAVAIETEIKEHQLLTICIYDDGPGFDVQDIPYIFDRFYKGRQGQFGLGLAISKNIIEKHNGKLTAKNRQQGGALFIFELPISD